MPAPDLWRRSVRRLLADPTGVSDADLLGRFRAARDEAAFELLVYRHGPLVWAACRRLLTNHQDAEDAFQATFLALARRAGSIRRAGSVPAWLHRVAVRAARRLARTRRPAGRLDADPADPAPGPDDRAAAADLARRLDAAVDRLPERLRRVFVACDLRGDALADVAARLRCPVGTVASRLARARERLRDLLAVGGVTGLTVVELVPGALRAATVRAAVGGPGVRRAVAALARRAGGTGWAPGLVASVVAVAAAAGISLGIPGETPPAEKPPAAEVRDAAGPLPAGAVARLGSSRFRTNHFLVDFAFSPDGRLVAGVSSGRRLSVWEVGTGREVSTVTVPDGEFQRVQWTADGRHVLTGPRNEKRGQELRGYDARTGRPVFRVGGGEFGVDWKAGWRLGPDDTVWLSGAVGAGKRELRGFELRGGRTAGRVPVPDGATLTDWTPNGVRLLLTADGRVTLHDVKTGPIWTVDARPGALSARLTPNGKRVVTHEGSRLRVRDGATGKIVADVDLSAGPGPEPAVPMAVPHDKYAVVGREFATGRREALVVDLDRGRLALSLPDREFEAWAISPDGRHAATAGMRAGTSAGTSVWDLTRPGADPVTRLPPSWGARFSSDGRTLAVEGLGCLALYDAADWRLLPQSASPLSMVSSARFSPDGRGLVGFTSAGWQVWDDWSKPGSRPLFGPPDPGQWASVGLSADLRVTAEVTDRYGPDDKAVAGEVRVTDHRTGRTRTHPTAGWPDRDVVLSGDGRRVFAWGGLRHDYGQVRGWDTATGDPLPTWAVADAQPRATLAVSHDGKSLAWFPDPSGGAPDGVRLWDVDGGREVGRIKGVGGTGPGHPQYAEFSRDGRRLAAVVCAANERTYSAARVWDWRAGRQLLSVEVADFMTVVALSADGRALAVGDDGGRLRVFEVATGGERAAFRHGAGIPSVAFHPDGTRLAASSWEAPVYIWNLGGEPGSLDPARTDAVWADLGSADAKTAFAAMRTLRADPAAAVALFTKRPPRPAIPNDEGLADLLARLDAPRYADRERAQRELTAVAEWIRPQLEAARKSASEEAGRRLDQILKPVEAPTADHLRQVRACEVLEGVRSADARRLLEPWAAGAAGARMTIEAKESLDRLGK